MNDAGGSDAGGSDAGGLLPPLPISLCMIVKDEARLIGRCLERAGRVAAQRVVVDTGSTDDTPALARAAGAEVYHPPWEGSFSKARNISLSYAREPWVLILDGDELLDEGTIALLRALDLSASAPEAYELTIVNFSTDDADERAANLQWQIRLFRRALGGYGGAVHNQIMHMGEGRPLTAARAPARVLHYGYTPAVWAAQKKDERLALLERAAREEESPFARYNLGNHLKILGRHREALDAFISSLPSGPLEEEWMPIACCSGAFCASRAGLHEVALALTEQVLGERPLLLDAHHRRAEALGALGRHAEVVAPLAAALASPRREAIKLRVIFEDAPYSLGRALFMTGRAEEALPLFLCLASGARDVTVYTHLCLCALAAGEGALFRWARARGAALAPHDPDWPAVDARAALLSSTEEARRAARLPLALADLVTLHLCAGEGPAGASGRSAEEEAAALGASWAPALAAARGVMGEERLGLRVLARLGAPVEGAAVRARLELTEVGGRLVGDVEGRALLAGEGLAAARLPLSAEGDGALVSLLCAALGVELLVRAALA